MANGFDPRSQFFSSTRNLANQKRQALAYERQRQDAEERTKIQNVNTLSGFNAADIPEGPMRQIYEDRIRDAQAYMNGAGSYENQEYSALEAANKISGLTTLFNKMSAHNGGSVKEARDAYKKGAYEPAEDRERINPYGDPSGEAVYASNSPDGYRSRVQRHNNYFQWTGEYDANGDPLGYMIGDNGQPTGEPMSIFEMQGYANPSSFESDTVKEPIPALVDVVQDPRLLQRINTIATRNSTKVATTGMDAMQAHQYVIDRVLQDYMGTDKAHMEFRESIVRQLQMQGQDLNEEEVAAFVNDPASNKELLADIQKFASETLADLTYAAPTVSSPYSGSLFVASQGGTDVASAPYNVELSSLAEPITVSAGEQLPGTATSYNINGAGVDPRTGDLYMQINYEEEGDPIIDPATGFQTGTRTSTSQETLRIPFTEMEFNEDGILINAPSTLALEAFRNLPASEQRRIERLTGEAQAIPDEEIQNEMNNRGAEAPPPEPTAPPASTTATTASTPATTAAPTAATTASQPQQEETLDIQEMDPVEENFEDPVEDVSGAQLTPLAALPTRDVSLIERANEALRDPVMSTSPNYGPAARAAEETLRDPQATDRSRERAVSTLQEIVNQRDRVAEGPERRERAAFESDAEGVDPQVLEQYYNNVEPRAYGLYPLPEGATVSGSDVVRVNDQVVGRYESRLNPNTGQYVTGMRPMAVEPQSDFSRQVGESVSDASSAASNLARDIRDNAGSNLRRAYDAARETLGGAGSALMNFIRGGGPTQQEVDRQRFEAARERQRLEEEQPAVSVPDPETVATPEPTRGRGDVVDNIPVRPEPGSPRQAQAEVELRERLESEEDRLIEEQGVTMATPIEKGGVAFGSREERRDAKLEGRTQAFSNAVDLFKKLNAPFPVVAASQFVQESEQGVSDLVQDTNNGFGIKYDERVAEKFKERGIDAKKSDKTYRDSTEARTGAADPDAHYFSFPSVEEGFKAYLAFIELNPRYKEALAASSEMDYLRGLVKARYATGNDGKGGGYIEAISKIAKGYGFNIEDVAPEEPTTK